jgi:hypothetical protein
MFGIYEFSSHIHYTGISSNASLGNASSSTSYSDARPAALPISNYGSKSSTLLTAYSRSATLSLSSDHPPHPRGAVALSLSLLSRFPTIFRHLVTDCPFGFYITMLFGTCFQPQCQLRPWRLCRLDARTRACCLTPSPNGATMQPRYRWT